MPVASFGSPQSRAGVPAAGRDKIGKQAATFLGNTLPNQYQGLSDQIGALPNSTTFGPDAWAKFAPVGGEVGRYPTINQGPIYSEQQTNQMWNNLADQARQRTASGMLDQQLASGGRGVGASSPAQQEMQRRSMMQMNAALPGQESAFRFGAAGENAKHLLATQMAGLQRAGMMGAEDVDRRQLQLQGMLGMQGQDLQGAQMKTQLATAALGGLRDLSQPLPLHFQPPLRGITARSSGGGGGGGLSVTEMDPFGFANASTKQQMLSEQLRAMQMANKQTASGGGGGSSSGW